MNAEGIANAQKARRIGKAAFTEIDFARVSLNVGSLRQLSRPRFLVAVGPNQETGNLIAIKFGIIGGRRRTHPCSRPLGKPVITIM